MEQWLVRVGEHQTRAGLSSVYGGSRQGGIAPSARSSNVLVFSDPSVGQSHGYAFDGWVLDNSVFQYTGEGRVGDQLMISGNEAIRSHIDSGRGLRVFAADGIAPGTAKTKHQLYLGEFVLDQELPYFVEEAPDDNDDLRTVIVFRLRPVGQALRRSEDRCDNESPAWVSTVDDVPLEATVEDVPVEQNETRSFQRRAIESLTASRTEAGLVARYAAFLASQGHSTGSKKIRPAGATHALKADLYDYTTQELCEAKGSATRDSIRYAIGQLFDYQRRVGADSMAVLVPTRPAEDLVELLGSLSITCIYETTKGSFHRIPS
jgi:hypothetical protein